jgi:hypothetical protein
MNSTSKFQAQDHSYAGYARPTSAPDVNQPTALVLEVAADLRAHCADHPNAVDTVEDVRRWWLGAASRNLSLEAVEQALLLLVADGTIYRRALTDGTVLFFVVKSADLR